MKFAVIILKCFFLGMIRVLNVDRLIVFLSDERKKLSSLDFTITDYWVHRVWKWKVSIEVIRQWGRLLSTSPARGVSGQNKNGRGVAYKHFDLVKGAIVQKMWRDNSGYVLVILTQSTELWREVSQLISWVTELDLISTHRRASGLQVKSCLVN
jgi:hypothetical protein